MKVGKIFGNICQISHHLATLSEFAILKHTVQVVANTSKSIAAHWSKTTGLITYHFSV